MAKNFTHGEQLTRPPITFGQQNHTTQQLQSSRDQGRDRSTPSWEDRGPAFEAWEGDVPPPIPEHLKNDDWLDLHYGQPRSDQKSSPSQDGQKDASQTDLTTDKKQGEKPLDPAKDKQKLAWVSPLDFLDYLGLGIDIVERAYIEIGMKPGQEKEFARFANTLYFVIDAAMAILPGAGGGGLAIRATHEVGELAWRALPASSKAKVIQELAKKMGWPAAKASQAVNVFFSMKAGQGSGKTGTGQTQGGMSRTTRQWRAKYGPSASRQHHLVPQALLKDNNFIKRLKKLGIADPKKFIDKRISQIPNSQHIKVHEAGWNNAWKDWIGKHPNFTLKELEAQIKFLMKKFNIPRNTRNFTKSYGR